MRPILFRRRKPPLKDVTPPPQKHLERPSAQDIYEQVASNARQELGRSSTSLAISGLAGGIFMGLSALGNAIALAVLTPAGSEPSTTTQFIAKLFYPLGFIAVILGRAQLFTENTLYPVALVLAEKKHFWKTMKLWAVVLPCNVLGALAFAALATRTGGLMPSAVHSLAQLGVDILHHPAATIFWSGVMGGWIIATVAWLVSGSHSITGSVILIWMLTLVVGLANFAHCIASSGEVFSAILTGVAPWSAFLVWFVPAVLGNIAGGVGMVTLLEYGQVVVGNDAQAEALPALDAKHEGAAAETEASAGRVDRAEQGAL
ncbi:MAG: formate/nitrite transporter family protein [Acidobacteriota bacterium]|nr:formate/nitrite transporter family protein [Acidobacteriota bacterium]MDP9121073.1 formate/nitrite transporter family protein [Acidobacteriota bacterium]